MRSNRLGSVGGSLHDPPEGLTTELLGSRRREDQIARLGPGYLAPHLEILVEQSKGHLAEGHESPLAPLTLRSDDSALTVHLAQAEPDDLARPEAGAVGKTEHGAIPETSRLRGIWGGQQSQDLVVGEGLR